MSGCKIITIANLKGGSGKSTVSMNLAAGLLKNGHSVLCIDADAPQFSLFNYISNRNEDLLQMECVVAEDIVAIKQIIDSKKIYYEFILIDTSGSLSELNKEIHKLSDMLVTPLNDSMLDLDLIMKVSKTSQLGAYGQFIWDLKKQRSMNGQSFDWIVVRNRMSSLYNKNKERMELSLKKIAKIMGFELLPGIIERVAYKNSFDTGMTVFDLDSKTLTNSQLMARQEMRLLVKTVINLSV